MASEPGSCLGSGRRSVECSMVGQANAASSRPMPGPRPTMTTEGPAEHVGHASIGGGWQSTHFPIRNRSRSGGRLVRADRASTITDEGEAVVVLPSARAEAEAYELVHRHRRWIATHQGRIRAQVSARAERPEPRSRSRDPLPAANRSESFRLPRSTDGATRQFSWCTAAWWSRSPPLETTLDRRDPRTLVPCTGASRDIEERVAARGLEMGLSPKRITIRDQKTRWGSASRRGTLSFSWRLDAVSAVRCSTTSSSTSWRTCKVAGHGRGFWRMVERHFPDARGARKWLRDHHDEVRHALD